MEDWEIQKKMKTILLFIALFCFGLFIACQRESPEKQANSSSQSNTSKVLPENIQPGKIVESVYKVESNFGDHFLLWAAIIENPNTNLYGLFPVITITARDEKGNVVGTEDHTLSEFPPAKKIAFAGQVTLTNLPKTVEFTFTKVEWRNTQLSSEDYLPFPVEKLQTVNNRTRFTVSGDVNNPYSKDVESVAITTLLRDESGKLIGGGTSYLNTLPAKSSRPYTDRMVWSIGKPSKTEVFVSPSGSIASWNKIAFENKKQ